MIHSLKTERKYFNEVATGNKTFEMRFNDRDFKVGDILNLREYLINNRSYTGEEINLYITYVLEGFEGLKENWVVLGLGNTSPKVPVSSGCRFPLCKCKLVSQCHENNN